MVTHDAHAASRADRVLFLKDGEIVQDHDGMTSDAIYEVIKGLETGTRG
jgi:putative ABC transport system ATP-binding protein